MCFNSVLGWGKGGVADFSIQSTSGGQCGCGCGGIKMWYISTFWSDPGSILVLPEKH